jgi:hypothetical protein
LWPLRRRPADAVDGFCWTPGDDENCHNVPQGITTSRDATKDHEYGSPPPQLIVVSWYYRDDCDPDAPETRSRVTLVDWDKDWTPNAYRKVLLVEPFRRTVGPSSQLDFRDIPIHAGGVMWYGDYLYVADTYAGLRVFDMRRILEVDGGGSEDGIGFNSSLGVYRAHQYQYVLPQVGRVTDIGSNPLRWSTIGLDRGTVPDSFVVAEYQTSGPVNAARFPLDYRTYQPMPSGDGIVHASQALEVHHYSINGVVSHNRRWWFAQSTNSPNLFYWPSGAATATAYPWVTWAESLSYWESSTGPDWLWNLREIAGGRNVFAVEQQDYD